MTSLRNDSSERNKFGGRPTHGGRLEGEESGQLFGSTGCVEQREQNRRGHIDVPQHRQSHARDEDAANLTGADLTGANLKGANLKGANLHVVKGHNPR